MPGYMFACMSTSSDLISRPSTLGLKSAVARISYSSHFMSIFAVQWLCSGPMTEAWADIHVFVFA